METIAGDVVPVDTGAAREEEQEAITTIETTETLEVDTVEIVKATVVMKGATTKVKETTSNKIVIRATAAANAMVLIVGTTIVIKATAAISEAASPGITIKVTSSKDPTSDLRGVATRALLVEMAITTISVGVTTVEDRLVTKPVEVHLVTKVREEVLLEVEMEETQPTRTEMPLSARTNRRNNSS